MKHLVYLAWVGATAGYLFLANSRGWSLIHTMSPARLFTSSSGHGSGFHHK